MKHLLGKKVKFIEGKAGSFSDYGVGRVLAVGKKYPDNILITNPEVLTEEDFKTDKLQWTTWVDTKRVKFEEVGE